ncbi:MAG: purine-nucleoside phosphorylase [Verrucomicrobia subdivision 3 bacterium]|nr:purine-nucleoside phosphorylase [Limisphaerales bacterium]
MQRALSPDRTAAQIRRICPNIPSLAVILGSGFAGIAGAVEIDAEIPCSGLPGFPEPGTAGHSGRLICGKLNDVPIICLCGRSHFYEGYTAAEITFPIRVLAALGVKDILLTNAVGGIRRGLRPSDFMLVTDHINLLPENPLRGMVGTDKFLDMTIAYDPGLRDLLVRAARAAKIRLRRGVYLAVAGPSYETPAEIRAFARLGADAVGMSTVPEVIVARHCGLRVAAISCITNFAAGRSKDLLSHADVLITGEMAQKAAEKLLKTFVRLYAKG